MQSTWAGICYFVNLFVRTQTLEIDLRTEMFKLLRKEKKEKHFDFGYSTYFVETIDCAFPSFSHGLEHTRCYNNKGFERLFRYYYAFRYFSLFIEQEYDDIEQISVQFPR